MISPLLANIALHGMETAVKQAFPKTRDKIHLVRYADDFVAFQATEEGIKKAKAVLEAWIQEMGLELKASKTRITHTFQDYQGTVGFDFLGWTVRQFPVGKTHSGKAGGTGALLGFKTIITPSKEAVKQHTEEVRQVIKRNRHASQGKLIKELNATISGWTHYHRTVAATQTFGICRKTLFLQLQQWAKRRHPNKGRRWIADKYWHVNQGHGWIFTDQHRTLWDHTHTHIQRHVKVKGTASPYDGNLLYWSQRLSKHYLFSGTLGRLLRKQKGRCTWCGRLFTDEDQVEIDHILPRSLGGGEQLSNKYILHRHCHQQRHARREDGTPDKGHVIEEPCEAKVSRTVLKTSRGGDSLA